MSRLSFENLDANTLQELGRAAVQIVHDLKNQLNGLKLYATFLRKRMDSSDRPVDEQETIGKLIAGLERAAADMTSLVRFGRPLELRDKAATDLVKLLKMTENSDGLSLESERDELTGDFDVAAITEAFATITSYAIRAHPTGTGGDVSIHLAPDARNEAAVIEWKGLRVANEDDPFRSFAGSEGIRMSLARKIIEAHGGHTEHDQTSLRVRLPLEKPA